MPALSPGRPSGRCREAAAPCAPPRRPGSPSTPHRGWTRRAGRVSRVRRIGLVLRLRDSPREHLLVLVPELHEDDADRRVRLNSPPSRAFATGSLSPSVRTMATRDVDSARRSGDRGWLASAFSDVAPVRNDERGGGCSIGERAVERRSEDLLVGAREEVREHAIRQRCDARPARRAWTRGSRSPRPSPARCVGATRGSAERASSARRRARRSLGVGSHGSIPGPCEHRLRRSEARASTPPRTSPSSGASRRRARLGDAERRPRAARAATDPTQRHERDDEAKCEEGSEWRECGQRHRKRAASSRSRDRRRPHR